jgi:spore germination protein GerM
MFPQKSVWLFLLVGTMLVAGCGVPQDQDGSRGGKNGTSWTEQNSSLQDYSKLPAGMMQLTTYEATKDGLHLVAVSHAVPKNDNPAQTALELLAASTSTSEGQSVIPLGTKVLGLEIRNNIAFADFNDKLVKNNPGGSTDELLLVGAIVDTLTEFPDIQKVQIMVNGKRVSSLSGHVDTSEPLSRAEKIIKH